MFHKESKLEEKTETLFEKVCRLAIAQDENTLASMVKAGVHLHVYQNEYFPVTWLAEKGEHRAVELLIKKFKASCHHAVEGYARGGYVDYVNNLIAEGGDRDAAAWGYACKGNVDQVIYQLKEGADPDSAVSGYAAAGRIDLVNSLLIQGASLDDAVYGYALRGLIDPVMDLINQEGASRNRAIFGYARGANFDRMASLIESFPYTLDEAIRGCACGGYVDQVNRLREQGAHRDAAAQGFAFGGHIEQVQDLLTQGASRNSAMIGYAQGGHVDQVKYHIEQGANRDDVMWLYARYFYIDQVDQLIEQGGSLVRAINGYSKGFRTVENVLRLMTLTNNKKLREGIATRVKGSTKFNSLDTSTLLIKSEKLNFLMKKMQLNYVQAKSLTFISALWMCQATQLVTSDKLPAEMFLKITSYLLGLSDRDTRIVQKAVHHYRSELQLKILWREIIVKLDPATIAGKVALVSRSIYEMATSDIVREKKLQQYIDTYYASTNSELSAFSIFRTIHRDKDEKYSPMIMKWLYFLREGENSLFKMNKLNIKEMMPLLTEGSIDSLFFYRLWIWKNQRICDYLFELIFYFFAERKLGYNERYNGYTLLHYLARLGPSKKLVKTLIPEFNASNPVFDEDGFPPLLNAIGYNLIATCDLLIEHHAPLNIGATSNRYPPLYYAALLGHAEIVESLYHHGIRHVDEPKHWGLTPLHGAVFQGQILAAEKLLDFGADPNFSENGCTLLHTAAAKGHAEMIKLLCERGAIKTINQAIWNGKTSMHLACECGHFKAVTALLKLGADPRIKNHDGNTPLIVAINHKSLVMIHLLVEAFPDLIYVTDNNGKRPIEYLQENPQMDRSDIYSYLEKMEENKELSTSLVMK